MCHKSFNKVMQYPKVKVYNLPLKAAEPRTLLQGKPLQPRARHRQFLKKEGDSL